MHIFRAAAESGDARKDHSSVPGKEREISIRRKQHRDAAEETTLRHHLSIDLANLMNTIHLEAMIPLDDAPFVAKSIINFGFNDMSNLYKSGQMNDKVAKAIRNSLINFEPRLIPESIEIQRKEKNPSVDQRLAFEITAEMLSSPVDIPLNFMAEVDLGVGKMKMTRLRLQV